METFRDRVRTKNEKAVLRPYLLKNGMAFMKYFFQLREGARLNLNWHMFVIDYVLQAVMDGKINRLIINIAPGYLKTELAVINFICRGFATNPRSKFLHISYSDMLVGENSSKIKDCVLLDEFKELYPFEIRKDKKGKNLWGNTVGGLLRCAPSQGQIAGFRAGRMEEGFSGALIVDDPLKPEDAYRDPVRAKVNNRMTNTIKSRLGTEAVPIIAIMQALHEDGPDQYLLKGGSGDRWHHLSIPTSLDQEWFDTQVNDQHTHAIPIDIQGVLDALNGKGEYDFSHNMKKTKTFGFPQEFRPEKPEDIPEGEEPETEEEQKEYKAMMEETEEIITKEAELWNL